MASNRENGDLTTADSARTIDCAASHSDSATRYDAIDSDPRTLGRPTKAVVANVAGTLRVFCVGDKGELTASDGVDIPVSANQLVPVQVTHVQSTDVTSLTLLW